MVGHSRLTTINENDEPDVGVDRVSVIGNKLPIISIGWEGGLYTLLPIITPCGGRIVDTSGRIVLYPLTGKH